MAIHQSHRLLSLTLAGWDPVSGPNAFADELGGPMVFETALKRIATAQSAELTAWVTEDSKPGLAACLADYVSPIDIGRFAASRLSTRSLVMTKRKKAT